MKKILILIVCLLPVVGMNAQTQKAQKEYLPVEGEWAIGVDVIPILKYVGNSFNGNLNNGLDRVTGTSFIKNNENNKFKLVPDVSIMGKYMLTDEWALRANIGFMIRSQYNREYSVDDRAVVLDPLSEDKVIDKEHLRRHGVSVALGGEYRKGTRRVQGVFGGGVLFAWQKDKATYNWGNELTNVNQMPTSNFNPFDGNGYRTLQDYSVGSDWYTGITGSAGVEWFMCPKISLGAEVNITAYYLFGSQTYRESEGYNKSTGVVEKRMDTISPGSRGFYFGTESLGGSLYMTFYF